MSRDKWEAWCTDETQWRQLMRLIQAVHPCIPKKYRRHLRALFRHFPEASTTYRIETTTASLGLLWHCDPEEAVRDLHRMTVRSHGTMTYSLGESQFCLGNAIQIHFTVDMTKGHTNGERTR